MARRVYERNVKVRFAETLTDYKNPTAGEWAGATNLSPFIPKDGVTVPNQQNMVDNATINDVFDAQLVGSYGGPLTLTFFRDDDPEVDPAGLWAWDDRGFIMIAWFGEPVDGEGAPVANARVDVYPVAAHEPVEQPSATNENQKVQVQFAVTSEPAKKRPLSPGS